MKIRFTKFLAATMAAMTVASCSNEEQLSTQPDLTPGSARVTFNMGGGQTTTRGLLTDGGLIKDVQVKLFKQSTGAEITGLTQTMAGSTVTVTVPAGSFTSGEMVEWRLAANTTGYTKTAGTGGANALADEDASTIIGSLPGENEVQDPTKPGLPASFKAAMALNASTNEAKTSGMSRIPARVIVARSAGSTKSISGYTISSTNAATGADFYTGVANSSTQDGVFDFTVAKNEADVIGYFYPAQTAVTLNISNGGGTPKIATFTPVKNKSYKLTITPSEEAGSQDFTVSMNPWDEGEEDMGDVNFGTRTLKVKADATLPAGLSVGTDGELVVGAGDKVEAPITFASVFEGGYSLVGVTSVSRALPADFQISKDGMFAIGDVTPGVLDIKALVNYGPDVLYPVMLKVSKDGKEEDCSFDVRVKGLGLPENFTSTVNDVEIVNVGMQSSLQKMIDVVRGINETAGSTFVERTKNYIGHGSGFATREQAVMGLGYAKATLPNCPKGFAIPSAAQMTQLFGGVTLPSGSAKVTLKEGVNTLGNSTLTMTSAVAGTVQKHFILKDAHGREIYLPGGDSAAAGMTKAMNLSCDGKNNRVVLWNNEFQYRVTSVLNDNYLRCVKVAQSPYTN